MPRTAEIARKTKETDIKVRIDLDGRGVNNIDTGIGFFDHIVLVQAFNQAIGDNVGIRRYGSASIPMD